LLLTLGGSAYTALGGLGGSVMVPEGNSFEIGQGLKRGAPFSRQPGRGGVENKHSTDAESPPPPLRVYTRSGMLRSRF